MKSISVILAFHAQEPLWQLPRQVVASMRDEEMRACDVGNDDWIAKRVAAGRDVYRDLIALARRLGAPLCLEATNEVLMQVRRQMPETFAHLGEAYRAGQVYPVYGNAFHTHIAMLSDDELADELRLNREYVHDVLGAPVPKHAGAFPMEGSIDAHKLDGFRRAGMEYVIFPNLSPKKARYQFDTLPDGVQEVFTAFTIGDIDPTQERERGPGRDGRLLALPRHYPISQEIWRPITKWQPERLVPQGYILGKYRVLDEEYASGTKVAFPITRKQAVGEYCETLRRALRDAPDGGLLLYIQDLELMDFGEEALDILGEAWSAVRSEDIADVRIVTPDTYVDEALARGEPLPHLRFHQVSWAPEIRLVLRSDGHYPPLHAGPFRDVDNDEDVFRRWPFIFWEPGRFIVDTSKTVLASFGHLSPGSSPQAESGGAEIPLTAIGLEAALYNLAPVDSEARLAIHMRAMQRSCNFGWQPDEARHKWPYMHAGAICEILRDELKRAGVAERTGRAWRPLPERALRGLDRVLEVFIDTRVAYLRRGIERLGERAGPPQRRTEAEAHLRNAERRRKRASALARQVQAENAKLAPCAAGARSIGRVLALLGEHCREGFLALNEIQRAWMSIDDTAGMIEEMYAWLYDLYPPRFPSILRELLTPEELSAVESPELG